MTKILSGLKFFAVIMAIATANSLVFHFFAGQIRSKYIVEAALSYHREFSDYLDYVIKSRKIMVGSSRRNLPPPASVSPTSAPLPPTPIPTPPPPISEAELYGAISNYRSAHDRGSLVLEENLCVYARRRVDEHLDRLANLKSEENPLDGHGGFQRDADSGEVFKITDMAAVAENLAYLPDYAAATQIVEWGWDTSTAHRDAQLSNEWTHVCLSGKYPFYVGIFGHR